MSKLKSAAPFAKPVIQGIRAAVAKEAAEVAAAKAAAKEAAEVAAAKAAAANGMIRDPITGKWMRAADLPHPGEGADLGGKFSPSGFDRDPATGRIMPRVPVDESVTPLPAPPGSALVPAGEAARSSADVARFLEEANAAKAASNASLSKFIPAAIMGTGAAAVGAGAGLYNDLGQSIGPAEGASGQAHSGPMLSAADAYRLGMTQRPPQEEEHPAVKAATQAAAPAQRDAPTPPPRPAEFQQSMLGKIFNGGNYQSNSRLVSTPTDTAPVNWGDADRSSDFFRASKQLMDERAGGDYARGGMPTAHEHALHKALHIIHHLLSRGGRA